MKEEYIERTMVCPVKGCKNKVGLLSKNSTAYCSLHGKFMVEELAKNGKSKITRTFEQ